MKKIRAVAVIAVITCAFTSCKKDYNCTCIVYDSNGANATSNTTPIKNTTQSSAQSTCTTLNAAAVTYGGPGSKCTL